MNKQKIKISVATTAYNEEVNIGRMLKSVCNQVEKNTVIIEILVISDGSSDGTVKAAKDVGNKRIRILDDGRRMGQPARIGQILRIFRGDYLILLDSDMILGGKLVVEKMAAEFLKNKEVVFIGAHARPIKAKTLLEQGINNYRYAREILKKEFSFNNSAYGAHACLGYSKKFARSLKIPNDVMNVDSYSYFSCLASGFKFVHIKDAVVWYRSPQTVEDQIKQASRHLAGRGQLYKYLDKDLIDRGFFVPKNILLKLMLIQLFKNPLAYVFLKMVNLYSMYKAKKKGKVYSNQWGVIKSSKALY